jgi:hypothetical protein
LGLSADVIGDIPGGTVTGVRNSITRTGMRGNITMTEAMEIMKEDKPCVSWKQVGL